MDLDRNTLAAGYLPSLLGDLYIPRGGKSFLSGIMLYNSGASAEDVALYYNNGASDLRFFNRSMAPDESYVLSWDSDSDVVPSGAKITGQTDTGSTVTYKVFGVHEGQVTTIPELWAHPESPHKYNDEFEFDTLDSSWSLLSGSWSWDTVDAYDTAFTTGTVARGQLASDERRSWLLVQPPATPMSVQLYKPTVWPTDIVCMARMKWQAIRNGSIVNEDNRVGLFIFADSGGSPDTANAINCYLNESDTNIYQGQVDWYEGGSVSATANTTDIDSKGQCFEYIAVQRRVTTDYHVWFGTSAGTWLRVSSRAWTGGPPAYVSLHCRNNARNTSPGVPVYGFDFIRFFETSNFLF